MGSIVGLEASWECGLLVGHPLLQVVGQSENPPSFFTSLREFPKGPRVAPLQYLALLVTGGPVDHSSVRHTGRRTANHSLNARVKPPGPETSLCHALSPHGFCPLLILSGALSDPQMVLSSGKPPKFSPHCPPAGSPPTCCLRCTRLSVPSKMVPLVLPRKVPP